MAEVTKPRAVGLNHLALEVGDIEEALAFYGRLFAFDLRGKSDTMAFIDLGDQFLALHQGPKCPTRNGSRTLGQERECEKGIGREGHGARVIRGTAEDP
jgi:catechol 2,3-dioxygenase-like lactoylglutathione lyase family enzyme